MKTIGQALVDEIHYPVGKGNIENRLMARVLNPDDECTPEIITSVPFIGAVADCLYSLIEAVNFSEADKSISLPNRDILLKKVNAIYRSIGEPEKVLEDEKPMVYIGG